MQHTGRGAAAAVMLAVALGGNGAAAHAGQYAVAACGDRAPEFSISGLELEAAAAAIESTGCHLSVKPWEVATQAAAPGTTMVRTLRAAGFGRIVRLKAWHHAKAGQGWRLAIEAVLPDGARPLAVAGPGAQPEFGRPGAPPQAEASLDQALLPGASAVRISASCTVTEGTCGSGGLAYSLWRLEAEIVDEDAPVIEWVDTARLNGPVSGMLALPVRARDEEGGIAAMRLSSAGVARTTLISCSAAGSRPCPLADEREAIFDTKTVSDGQHELTLSVIDRAGNTATRSWTIETENFPDPAFARPPEIDGRDEVGSALQAVPAWSVAPRDQTTAWERCEGPEGPCAPIEGAAGPQYTLTEVDSGKWLRARVRGWTGADSVEEVTAPVGPFGAPPRLLEALGIARFALVGTVLETSGGRWQDAQRLAVHWERCATQHGGCVIAGRGPSYRVQQEDRGSYLKLVVTAENIFGKPRTEHALTTEPVRDRELAMLAPPAVGGDLFPGGRIVASPGSWSSSGEISFGTEWLRCRTRRLATCSRVRRADGRELRLSGREVGRWFRVRVTAVSNGDTQVQTSPASGPVAPTRKGLALPEPTAGWDNFEKRVLDGGMLQWTLGTIRVAPVRPGSLVVVRCIECAGQARFRRASWAMGRAVRFQGLNWILGRGRIQIDVTHSGWIGRRLTVRAELKPTGLNSYRFQPLQQTCLYGTNANPCPKP